MSGAHVSISCAVYPTTVGLPVVPLDACTRTTLLARHREHAERIVVAQIVLHGERKLREILERAQVPRMHAGGIEAAR